MSSGLSQDIIARIQGVLARFKEVQRAVLYGSRAKGTHRPGSDIDLTLSGAGLTSPILGKIERELEEGPMPYCFDLSLQGHIAAPDLLEHIQRVGIVFYKKQASGAA